MSDVDITLIGDEELLKIIIGLDRQTQHRDLKKVVSNAANVYVKGAKKVIPRRTTKLVPPSLTQGGLKRSKRKWHPPGTGKKSPFKKMGKSKRNVTYFVGPKTGTGDRRTDAWYLRFWEKGTRKLAGSFAIQRSYETNDKKVENLMFNSMRNIMVREIKKYAKR